MIPTLYFTMPSASSHFDVNAVPSSISESCGNYDVFLAKGLVGKRAFPVFCNLTGSRSARLQRLPWRSTPSEKLSFVTAK